MEVHGGWNINDGLLRGGCDPGVVEAAVVEVRWGL